MHPAIGTTFTDSEVQVPEAAETPAIPAEAEAADYGEVDGTLYEGLEPEQPPEGEPEGTQPPGDDTLVTVVIDGVESQVPLKEALAGYQRQADYTRKTQEVSARQAELDQAARLYAALEADPNRTLAALAAAYGFEGTPAGSDDEGFEEPPDPIATRLAEVNEWIAQQQEQETVRAIEGAIANLHTRYGEFDNDQLLQFAIEHSIPDLDVAYAAMAFSDPVLQAARAKAQADAAALAAKGSLPPVAGGHGVQGGSVVDGGVTVDPKDMTLEETWNATCRAAGREDLIVPIS